VADGDSRDPRLAGLIEAAARGEQKAFDALYAATIGRVYGLALRIVRSREAAEEVAIDVFVQVWHKASTYDAARGSPLAWLLTICRSRALDYLRRADPAEAHPDPASQAADDAPGRSPDPQDLLLACEGQARLRRALATLEPLQRQLIALAFFRGHTHAEIAAQARLPLGTVKTAIRRALRKLRAQLETTDGTPP